jgi:hypothetical protein
MKKTPKKQLAAKGSSYIKAKESWQNVGNTRRVKLGKGDRIQYPRPKTRLALENQTNEPPWKPKFKGKELDRKAEARGEDKGQERNSLRTGPMKTLPKSVKTQETQLKDQDLTDSRMRNAWKIWPSNTVSRQNVQPKNQGKEYGQIQKEWGHRLSSRR